MALLKPEPMSKISVLGLKKYRQQIISILQEMSVMQLEPVSSSVSTYLTIEHESDLHRQISDQLLRIRGLINSLPPSPSIDRSKFLTVDHLFQELASVNIDKKIASLERQKEDLLTKITEIGNNIKLIEEFSFFPEDLRILNLSSAHSYFGRVSTEKFPELKKKLDLNDQDVLLYPREGPKTTYFVLVILSHFPSNALASIVNIFNVQLEAVPKLTGKPSEVIQQQKNLYDELTSKLNHVNGQLSDISKTYYSKLKGLEEQLEIENKKLEAIDNLGTTKEAFTIEGWIPTSKIEMTKNAFDKHSEGTILFILDTKDKPPTLQNNPKRFKVFESFIRFYSLPAGNEFDPTMIFGIVFPIFYGLMLGDVGYAIFILLVSKWVIRRVEGGKRDFTIMPGFLRNFAKTILLPVQMVKLAKAIIPGCVIAIILGFFYDLYFGFHLNGFLFSYLNNFGLHLPASGAFLDPIGTWGLRKLLLVSGYIGLGMVSFGLVLGIINSLREGLKRHAIGKVGWLLFGWAIVLIGLALIHHQNISPTGNINGSIYFAMIFGGIGLMFYGEGVRAMMELPSIISHILSYTRIVGIFLASVILADVIDFIFIKTLHHNVPYIVFGVAILFIGHIFNIVLGVFEPGIQGARLIYVEFFSKFYHGLGKPFKPFGIIRRYTLDQFAIDRTKE